MRQRFLIRSVCIGLAALAVACLLYLQAQRHKMALAAERAVSADLQAKSQRLEMMLNSERIVGAVVHKNIATLLRNRDYAQAIWKTDSAMMSELWVLQMDEDASLKFLQAWPLDKESLLSVKAFVLSEAYGFQTNRAFRDVKEDILSFLLRVN